ncbi:MAG: XRE family transcriptional regulator [Desulfobacterales bacterium]|jgi:transcriptional regulator with XRE-family HTH domain/KaiC/GvpD/RAD55 family RecA-like ATPase
MKDRVTTGIDELDSLIDGLHIGDNVIWYDDAGSLADVFYLNLIRSTIQQKASLIYVSFDRSLKNLMAKLGPLAQAPSLTIIDCFTYGKGNGADIFVQYQRQIADNWPGTLLSVERPDRMEEVAATFYTHQRSLGGTVRFVFESLTGMRDLWGGEDQLVSFYVRACPRLYDLNTIAYWLIEKQAHSSKLRAQINQIAQVVIDLSVQRGKTALDIVKAENRPPTRRNKSYPYFSKDMSIHFNPEARSTGKTDLGARIKSMRNQAGLSQTELAKQVGVTPSSISQIESGLIYPSLPALFRMAEVFAVDMGTLFQSSHDDRLPIVLGPADIEVATLPALADAGITCWRVPRIEAESGHQPNLIEIPPQTKLREHFFRNKAPEIGFLISGKLRMRYRNREYDLAEGDFIYLDQDWPSAWENTGHQPARLLWLVTG